MTDESPKSPKDFGKILNALVIYSIPMRVATRATLLVGGTFLFSTKLNVAPRR